MRKTDLVTSRLLAEEALPSIAIGNVDEAVAFLQKESTPLNIGRVIKNDEATRESFRAKVSDSYEYISGGDGLGAITALHLNPCRVIYKGRRNVLIGIISDGEGNKRVLIADWSLELSTKGGLEGARLESIEEYSLPQEIDRLENALRGIAAHFRFRPPRPSVRGLILITPSSAATFEDGIDASLVEASAAIRCGAIELVNSGNPKDAHYIRNLKKLFSDPRYDFLITASQPSDAWVWKQARGFKSWPGRSHHALSAKTATDCYLEIADAVEAAEAHVRSVKVDSWGPGAVRLGKLLERESFRLTSQALGQLQSNSYPQPSKMLDHLIRLAQLADAFAASGDSLGERFEEWAAKSPQALSVALRDKGLGRTEFNYENEPYSSEPHVKVDDFVAPSECGRIYFAIDPKGKRLIVDYIGLHR